MSKFFSLQLSPSTDLIIQDQIVPITAIGGWRIEFTVYKRFFGVSGIILCSTNSGYSNVSGIQIVNSGNGIFSITVSGGAFSGQNPGNLAFTVNRVGSGVGTLLSEGYISYTY